MTDIDRALDDAEQDVLLTVKEYGALFKVTPRAVYYALKAGRAFPYPHIRPTGKEVRFLVPASLVAKLKAA